ncbi:hypothetical protein BA177_16605 [Woeseia oceani]|uniref:Uncharacterized protein n=1 Tax=Woeseia oceani TaxID=1548547 RepID=A0A193LJA2_9GAMM|nr:hypothetical protein BA177_16605 [Woeseia oceani]
MPAMAWPAHNPAVRQAVQTLSMPLARFSGISRANYKNTTSAAAAALVAHRVAVQRVGLESAADRAACNRGEQSRRAAADTLLDDVDVVLDTLCSGLRVTGSRTAVSFSRRLSRQRPKRPDQHDASEGKQAGRDGAHVWILV